MKTRNSLNFLTIVMIVAATLLFQNAMDSINSGMEVHAAEMVEKVITPIGSGTDHSEAIALQTDGKIVSAGYTHNGSNYDFAVVRYNSDLSLDSSFGNGGIVTTDFGYNDKIFGIALQSDGKIVVVGQSEGHNLGIRYYGVFAIARYNTDGSLDPSFDTDGKVTTDIGASLDGAFSVVIQNDGKIVAGGLEDDKVPGDFAVVRYNSDGSLDTTFGVNGIVDTPIGVAYDEGKGDIMLQPDGKLILTGHSDIGGPDQKDWVMVRYNSDGSLDTSFGNNGKVITDFGTPDDFGAAAALQSDGKVILVGRIGNSQGLSDIALARYEPDGSLDTTFGVNGKVVTDIHGTNDFANQITLDRENGKIILTGSTDGDMTILQYNNDGSLDPTFGNNGFLAIDFAGANDWGTDIVIQNDGQYVIGGYANNGTDDDFALARYQVNETVIVDAGGPYGGDEGSPIALTGSATDPDDDSLTINWSVDSPVCAFSDSNIVNPTLTCDDNGNYTVTLTVNDGVNAPVSSDATVTVENVVPTATFNAPADVGEGSDLNLSLTDPSDPSSVDTTAGFEYAFDCGDGGGFGAYGTSNSIVCPTDDNGTRTVKGQIRDKDGGVTEYIASVTVNNVAPTVGDITGAPTDPIQVGTTINVSASFSDPGTADTHIAEWDWDDNSTSTCPPDIGECTVDQGDDSVNGSHTYTEPGVYTVRLTVADDDGDSGASIFQFVVVYDPEGGFVTGGGWIDSPEGACAFDACTDETIGKATFGFVSKYKKGADVPTGQTEFQFKAGNLNFHSSSYQWLVVAGPKAQFKGDGTINGEGNYGFMLTAVDETLTPSTDSDLFRIKIWDKDSDDEIVYDNQMGVEDDADPTTEIGGGSIVIHKK